MKVLYNYNYWTIISNKFVVIEEIMANREHQNPKKSSRALLVPFPGHIKSIMSRVNDAKLGLIQGLTLVETKEGWLDPTYEKAQLLWTSIEVLKSIIEVGILPGNFSSILDSIDSSKKTINELTGWEYEGLENYISVYVTGDVLKLYLALCRFEDAIKLVYSLQKLQNKDGGWGVCQGDVISKVRSTSWVLSILIVCTRFEPMKSTMNEAVIRKGLGWLYAAQNDGENDFGWGNLPDTKPSNVSATTFALDAIIESLSYFNSPKQSLVVKYDAIKRGLDTLLGMRTSDGWKGVREEFAITVGKKVVGRHVIGGAGSTSILQVLIKAIDVDLLPWPNNLLYSEINNLANRCKKHSKYDGYWLIPADDGGPPLTWNSAYALDTIKMIEEFFTKHMLDKWIEKPIYERLIAQAKLWRSFCFALAIALVAIILAPHLKSIGNLTSWFSNLPTLYQGLVMMVVTLIFERVYKLGGYVVSRIKDRENR